MAGPSVVVRVLGDVKGLGDSFKAAGDTAGGAIDKIHGAFSSVLGTLNQTGVLGGFGEALDGIDGAFEKIIGHGKDVGTAMLGVGGALAGVGLGLQAIGSKDQAAHQQLQASIEATGKSYDDYETQIESAIKKQEKFGTTADQTQDALRTLTQATGDPEKALQLLGTASDLAAAKHEDLNTAAGQLGKTYNGATKLLKEFGLSAAPKAAVATKELESATKAASSADDAAATARQKLADLHARLTGVTHLTVAQQQQLRDAQQKVTDTAAKQVEAHQKLAGAQQEVAAATNGQQANMDGLANKLKGQASAAADTFTGKLKAIRAEVEDSAAAFGQKYGPAITAAGGVVTALGAAWQVAAGIKAALTTATEAGTVADEAATVAESSMLAPILLIIAAVAVLGIAIYELVTHWSTVWGAMKDAAEAVWNWIKTNWPLLLDILLGPIGIAVGLIVQHWDTIKNAAVSAFNWVRDNWPLLLAIITGPIGIAVLEIERNWGEIMGFFKGIPHQMAQIFADVWAPIENTFKAVLNGVIDLWNSLHFTLPKIDLGPLGKIGGGTIGVPTIPHLAQGGLITASGIVFAHAGEVISPAPASARAPTTALHIENATFASEVDVDMVAKRIEFATSAGLRL